MPKLVGLSGLFIFQACPQTSLVSLPCQVFLSNNSLLLPFYSTICCSYEKSCSPLLFSPWIQLLRPPRSFTSSPGSQPYPPITLARLSGGCMFSPTRIEAIGNTVKNLIYLSPKCGQSLLIQLIPNGFRLLPRLHLPTLSFRWETPSGFSLNC